MPPIWSSASKRRTRIIAIILSLGKVISACSRYTEKELVYITIASPSSRQPSSYTKYTRANIRSSYNIRSISAAKYTRLMRLYNRLFPYLIYYRVSCLIYC